MKKFTFSILISFVGALFFISPVFAQDSEVPIKAGEKSSREITAHFSNQQWMPFDDRDRGCDTLRFPLHGTIVYYTVNSPNSGYVTGNNSFGDITKAEYFDLEGDVKYIHKVLFDFAIARHTSGQDPNISFNIWSSTPGHPPGDVVGTEYIPLSEIVADVENEQMTEIIFDPAIQVEDLFYAGVNLPQSTGDTLALWSNSDGNSDPGTAWEQWDTGEWYAIQESWDGLSISQAIHPVVCDESGVNDEVNIEISIKLIPNPAKDHVILSINQTENPVKYEVFIHNMTGGIMYSTKTSNFQTRINTESYKSGLYFYTIRFENGITKSGKFSKL